MNKPRAHTNREKAWKVMRAMRTFTGNEICTIAEAPGDNIKHWIQCLVHAGYLRITGKKRQEGRPGLDNVYLLVKNTGPKPPVQKDLRFLFDQNTGEYWSKDPELVVCTVGAPLAAPGINGGKQGNQGAASSAPTGKTKIGTGVKLLCPRKRHVD